MKSKRKYRRKEFVPPSKKHESHAEYIGKNFINPPRPVEYIIGDYNKICQADELVIDQMLCYKETDVPKELTRQHKQLTSILRELDAERNYAIPFYHNMYRLHYAQTYHIEIKKQTAA